MAREGRTIEYVQAEEVPLDDVESAFNDWRAGLEETESPGQIRAFRIPLDEQGRASYSATGQVRLGAWPIDQYDFDTLCSKILREYMLPSETIMAVRLIGTLTSKSGVRFNKIVMLQRPNAQNALAGPASSSSDLSSVLNSMQQGQERMMRMFHEMAGPKANPEGSTEMMRMAAMMRVMMEPMTTMMGPMLAALAGRPPAPMAPGGDIKSTIETMMLMDRFMGRRGGSRESSSDFAQIATAVAGVAKPVLEMAAANANARNRNNAQAVRSTNTPITQSVAPQLRPDAKGVGPETAVPVAGVDLSQPSVMSPTKDYVDLSTPSVVGDLMFAETKKQIDAIVTAAQEGSDPDAVAERFFEDVMLDLPEAIYGKLCASIESDGYISSLGAYNRYVHTLVPWFERFRTRITQLIVEADQPKSDS